MDYSSFFYPLRYEITGGIKMSKLGANSKEKVYSGDKFIVGANSPWGEPGINYLLHHVSRPLEKLT